MIFFFLFSALLLVAPSRPLSNDDRKSAKVKQKASPHHTRNRGDEKDERKVGASDKRCKFVILSSADMESSSDLRKKNKITSDCNDCCCYTLGLFSQSSRFRKFNIYWNNWMQKEEKWKFPGRWHVAPAAFPHAKRKSETKPNRLKKDFVIQFGRSESRRWAIKCRTTMQTSKEVPKLKTKSVQSSVRTKLEAAEIRVNHVQILICLLDFSADSTVNWPALFGMRMKSV